MINREIKRLVFEIVILISIVISTRLLWNSIDYSKEASLAHSYANYNSLLSLKVNSDLSLLTPILDSEIDQLTSIKVMVENKNKVDKTFNLYLSIDNQETELNISYLVVYYNNKTYRIRELDYIQKGVYTYYKILEDSIREEDLNEYTIKLYLDKDTPNSEQNKTLKYSFEILES